MNIINLTKVCNAYQMQTWPDDLEIPEGNVAVADGVDFAEFFAYNGFVTLFIENVDGADIVTDYEPDVAAWETWKASLPEAEESESTGEKNFWDELDEAYQEGVNTAYDQ